MTKFLSACSAGALLFACGAASAQTVDYGALEEMFGEPVTMSATGKPQRVSEAPASMQIISGDAIRRSGANNLAEVLQNYAGIEVGQWSTDQYEVNIRGGSNLYNPRLLVLVNGQQVYVDYNDFTNWSVLGITLSEIRQIEVVRGPNSALFGFNAAAGVVNILTYDPLLDHKSAFTAEAGNRNHTAFSGMVTLHPSDKFGMRLSAGTQSEDEYDIDPDLIAWNTMVGFNPKQPSDFLQRNFNVDARGKLARNLQYSLGYTRAEARGTMSPTTWQTTYDHFYSDAYKAGLAYDGPIGLLQASFLRKTVDDYYDLTLDRVSDFTLKNKLTIVKIEDLFKIGTKNTFRLAAEYRKSILESVPDATGTLSAEDMAVSLMWEHAFSDQLTSMVAGRYDKLKMDHEGFLPPWAFYTEEQYSRTIKEPSYNLSLVYKPDQANSFRISTGRAIQSPSLFTYGATIPQLFDEEGKPGFVLSGDPTYKTPVVYSYDAAWTRRINALKGSFTANAFFMHNLNVVTMPGDDIRFNPNHPFTPNTAYAIYTARGDFNSYGLELTLNGKSDVGLDWEVNYTYMKVDENFPVNNTPAGLIVPVMYKSLTLEHKFNGRLGYTHGKFEADLYARFLGDLNPRELELSAAAADQITPVRHRDPSLNFDLRLAYHFGDNVELYAFGQNLTKSKAAGASSLDVDRRFRVGVRVTF